MFDVVALGELLIDFTPSKTSEQGNILLEANPGGAPCNVLAMLQKLGRKTAFIGKVGADQFGQLLQQTIDAAGIDSTGLLVDETVHTTLAFVHLDEHGDRTFSFYRNPGADMMLSEQELNVALLENCRIFHFGSLSMTDERVRKATQKAVATAKQNGSRISFDPNLRPPLWNDIGTAKEMIDYGINQCDILKISEDELQFISGFSNIDKAAGYIQRNYPNVKVMFVTLGKDGSTFYYKGEKGFCKPLAGIKPIDTTGAGDTFCGCVLHHLLNKDLEHL